jgi:3-dehydroquinate dehydratase type I
MILKNGCMICVPLSDMKLEECLCVAREEAFVEFRFDLLELSIEEVTQVVGSAGKCIATFRPGSADPGKRMKTLLTALESGATYVDIELESDPDYRRELIGKARSLNRQVIISHHDFKGTPEFEVLKNIAASCREAGADVVKIACTVNSTRDIQALMGLYRDGGRMVVIGMGDKGLITRIAAPFMGAEFTFASLSTGRETAPGQVDRQTLASVIAGIRSSFTPEK